MLVITVTYLINIIAAVGTVWEQVPTGYNTAVPK